MTGLGGPAQPIESSDGVKIPVTTGEFPTKEQSTVPERVISDIKPPEAPAASIQVPVQGEDEAMQTALGNIDKVAKQSQTAPSGLEIREENAGEPVEIKTDQATQDAVSDSLKGKSPESLEALVSADADPGPSSEELPPAMSAEAPAELPQAPIEAAAPESAPVAAPPTEEPAPAPFVLPPAPTEEVIEETPPDAAPVIGEPRKISRAEENQGVERVIANMQEYRRQRNLAIDRQRQIADQILAETDSEKQKALELDLRQVTREIDGWNNELNILAANMAFYINYRVGPSNQEQGPGVAGGVK